MDIVIDTSAIIATLVGEPEKGGIVEMTSGHSLVGPESIRWEIGNAFSAMLKQGRLSLTQGLRGLEIFQAIPLRYVPVNFPNALTIANKTNMYAYDAYFLDCALRHALPLLTLDRPLKRAAKKLNIDVLEV
jgi:predicted nucleic acid-binding protein